jgi:hypothetical protein
MLLARLELPHPGAGSLASVVAAVVSTLPVKGTAVICNAFAQASFQTSPEAGVDVGVRVAVGSTAVSVGVGWGAWPLPWKVN